MQARRGPQGLPGSRRRVSILVRLRDRALLPLTAVSGQRRTELLVLREPQDHSALRDLMGLLGRTEFRDRWAPRRRTQARDRKALRGRTELTQRTEPRDR
jgi:hypothetical protein